MVLGMQLKRIISCVYLSILMGCGDFKPQDQPTSNEESQQTTEEQLFENIAENVLSSLASQKNQQVKLRLSNPLTQLQPRQDIYFKEYEFDEESKYAQLFLQISSTIADIPSFEILVETYSELEKAYLFDQVINVSSSSENFLQTKRRALKWLAFSRPTKQIRLKVVGISEKSIQEIRVEFESKVKGQSAPIASLPEGFQRSPIGLNLVSREIWTSRYPKVAPEYGDWKRIVIEATGENLQDDQYGGCASSVRAKLSYFMDVKGQNDLGYHFVICPDGTVLEGKQGGMHSIIISPIETDANELRIALVGKFPADEADESVSSETTFEAQESLARLVGWLSFEVGRNLEKEMTTDIPKVKDLIQSGRFLDRIRETKFEYE